MVIGVDGNEANLENRVGVNQYGAELLNALYNLPEAKKHQWVIYLKNPPLPYLPKERKSWSYCVLPGRGFWVLRKLTPYLRTSKNRPDVLFTPSHYTPPVLPFPMVMSVMDLGYLRFPEQFRKYDYYQLKYWGAWSMRRAKKIIAISESTRKEIVSHHPWARNKIIVTHLGYDKKRFNTKVSGKEIERVKRKYGIKKDYILYLSTLKPSKNVVGLVEAYALVKSDLMLVIGGKKGWLYDEIFRKVKELKLEDRVIFTDFVPEEDKAPLLAGALVFASPSFWEGFGMHVLEAMACGTPAVVSNVGSLSEIVGNAGILVDPYDINDVARGLNKVVSLPESQYNKLAQESLEQAQEFNWEDTARKTLKVLENAV